MTKEIKRKNQSKIRRAIRVRTKIKSVSNRLRLSVFRSHKYLYAQIIDDQKGHTLVSVSEKELNNRKGTKTERAVALAQLLAQKCEKLNIKEAVFDRGPYQYHGRIKAFVEALRKEGFKI
jgi:large subunit ribosomal protein L18